jgi:hypothetical protein
MPILAVEDVVSALELRRQRLEAQLTRVLARFEAQGGKNLPFHVQALFDHAFLWMKTEIEFTDRLAAELRLSGRTGKKQEGPDVQN